LIRCRLKALAKPSGIVHIFFTAETFDEDSDELFEFEPEVELDDDDFETELGSAATVGALI